VDDDQKKTRQKRVNEKIERFHGFSILTRWYGPFFYSTGNCLLLVISMT
jgi:hypothetical protein